MKLVLLPGLDGTGLLFEPFIQALPDEVKRNVLVISYPNNNQSYAELVETVIHQLPKEDFVLVGESLSGNVVYQIALRKPEHLKSVVFIATFLSSPRPYLLKVFNILPRKILSITPPKFIVKTFLLGFQIKERTLQLFLNTIKNVPDSILSYRLKEINKLKNEKIQCDVKALYLQAEGDYLVPSNAVNAFKHLFTHLTIKRIEGPHFLLQAQPEECADLLLNFITES